MTSRYAQWLILGMGGYGWRGSGVGGAGRGGGVRRVRTHHPVFHTCRKFLGFVVLSEFFAFPDFFHFFHSYAISNGIV